MHLKIAILRNEASHLAKTDLPTRQYRTECLTIVDPMKERDVIHREAQMRTCFHDLHAVWLSRVSGIRERVAALACEMKAITLS